MGNMTMKREPEKKQFVPILLQLEIDGANLAFDLLQNLPEAMHGPLRCINWQYGGEGKPMKFTIENAEDGKLYEVNEGNAVVGLQAFLRDVVHGKFPGLSIGQDLSDAGNYDGYAVDCYVQYCIFGKSIYG